MSRRSSLVCLRTSDETTIVDTETFREVVLVDDMEDVGNPDTDGDNGGVEAGEDEDEDEDGAIEAGIEEDAGSDNDTGSATTDPTIVCVEG